MNYEPITDFETLLIRYGKVIHPKVIVTANFGYSKAPSFYQDFGPNSDLPRHLFTAGIESDYFLFRHIEKYPLSMSISGRYQYEHFDANSNVSEHHFDLELVAYYPLRYKKISVSPYGAYGTSDFSGAKFRQTRSIGGMIGFHFSETDYWYLLIYDKRYDNGTGDHRIFVSLGLLW